MTVMMVMVYGDEVSFAPRCVMVDGSKMTSLSGRMSNTSWDGGGWTDMGGGRRNRFLLLQIRRFALL